MLSLEQLQAEEYAYFDGDKGDCFHACTSVDNFMRLSDDYYRELVREGEETAMREEYSGRVLQEGPQQGYQPYTQGLQH